MEINEGPSHDNDRLLQDEEQHSIVTPIWTNGLVTTMQTITPRPLDGGSFGLVVGVFGFGCHLAPANWRIHACILISRRHRRLRPGLCGISFSSAAKMAVTYSCNALGGAGI